MGIDLRQSRAVVELRAAGADNGESARKINGKAVVFNSPTLIYHDNYRNVDYYEQIAPEAFANADMRDTCLRYNHTSIVPVLARVRGGSLKIDVRSDGVYFDADMFDTSAARDCYELVRQGALQCSFAFILPPDGGYTYNGDTHTRTITRIDRLIDLSIVDTPAYRDTFVQARAMFELEGEEQRRLESLMRRRELIARTI